MTLLPMASILCTSRLHLLVGLLMSASVLPFTECLHLTGTWNGLSFFKFLTRFGFQQTNMHDLSETQGYIYGNVTVADESKATRRIMLVVVDSEYFLDFFGNRSHKRRNDSCASMFTAIDNIAWDEDCHQNGKQDFLRRVPCPKDSVCVEETDPKQILSGHQLTYNVRDPSQPRFELHRYLFTYFYILFQMCVVVKMYVNILV